MIYSRFTASRHADSLFLLCSLLLVFLFTATSSLVGFSSLVTFRTFILLGVLLLSLVGIGVCVYLLWVHFSLNYQIKDDSLYIQHGFLKVSIPLDGLRVHRQKQRATPRASMYLPSTDNSRKKQYFLVNCLPLMQRTLVLLFQDKIIYINPQKPALFLSSLYRVQKLHTEEKSSLSHPHQFTRSFPLQSTWQITHDTFIKTLLVINILLLLGFVGFIFYIIEMLPNLIVVQYTIATGIQSFASKTSLLWYAVLHMLFFLATSLLSLFLYKKEKISAYIMLACYPVLTGSLLIVLLSLVNVSR